MMLYTLKQIRQQYKSRVVLDIDDLEIEQGRIYALLGPNGAGKTTLLNILGFLEMPASGRMTFRGQMVEPSRTALQPLRLQVVLVDQHPIMFSTLACSNIEFGLKIRRIGKGARERIVDEVLEMVGLRPFKFAAAHELSGGETQRLALARALALAPEVLLCDEPTASVDAENQAIIGSLLQQINRSRGTTIIFTTHDRLQAAALAQHTLVLENGRRANTTYENSYACALRKNSDHGLCCTVQGMVKIPLPTEHPQLHHLKPPADCRIYIDPEKITLNRADNQQHTEQSISGEVVLTMAEGEKIRVVVNIGVLIVVLMEHSSYHREHPAINEAVTLHLQAGAITLLDGMVAPSR